MLRGLFALLAIFIVVRVASAAAPPTHPAATMPTEPELSIAVNGAAGGEITRGSAIVIEAIFSTGAKPPELRLTVSDATGKAIDWPAERLADLLADDEGFAAALWVIAPERSAALPTGQHEVSVEWLDAKGESVTSSAADVTLVDAAAHPTPAQGGRRLHALVRYHFVRGQLADAERALDQWLALEPENIAALTLRGDLHFRAGRIDDADAAYDRALKAWLNRGGGKREPPAELLARQRAVWRALDAAATSGPATKPRS